MSLNRKQKVQQNLRKLLEAGYDVQEKSGVYRTPKIESFDEFVRQGWGVNKYNAWVNSIKRLFHDARLDFRRFKSKTESNDSIKDTNSPAAKFKRQLAELDLIVNDGNYFETYKLAPSHPEIKFKDSIISQGYASHRFNAEQHTRLIYLLWESRRIIDSKENILVEEKPVAREIVYKNLKIDHERFKDIVRGIKTEMKRKSIELDVKYPRGTQNVFIVIVQDSV